MGPAAVTNPTLSQDEARRIAVDACGPGRTFASVPDALGYLGIVQLDAINAVARAHELTLAARTGLRTTEVDGALWEPNAEPVAFEYMAHAASLIPIADWPLWAFRRRQIRNADLDWRPEPEVRDRLLAEIDARGPLSMRELRDGERASDGWSWSPTKTAVEYLIWAGELVCVRRRAWHRVFDLPHRALPAEVLNQDVDECEGVATLLTKAGRVMGVATDDDLADYLRISKAAAAEAVADTPLVPVRVQGWKQKTWAHPEALAALDGPAGPSACFVGPFDNLIWHRPRIRRLFDFDHTLEAYKPAAKRRYGYYALPLLVDGRLVGRADVKSDGDALHVLTFATEPGVEVAATAVEEAFAGLMTLTDTSHASWELVQTR